MSLCCIRSAARATVLPLTKPGHLDLIIPLVDTYTEFGVLLPHDYHMMTSEFHPTSVFRCHFSFSYALPYSSSLSILSSDAFSSSYSTRWSCTHVALHCEHHADYRCNRPIPASNPPRPWMSRILRTRPILGVSPASHTRRSHSFGFRPGRLTAHLSDIHIYARERNRKIDMLGVLSC